MFRIRQRTPRTICKEKGKTIELNKKSEILTINNQIVFKLWIIQTKDCNVIKYKIQYKIKYLSSEHSDC